MILTLNKALQQMQCYDDSKIRGKMSNHHLVNMHFKLQASTCTKLLGLLTSINMIFNVPKKVLVILVNQGAVKLTVLKVFVTLKSGNLPHRMLILVEINV